MQVILCPPFLEKSAKDFKLYPWLFHIGTLALRCLLLRFRTSIYGSEKTWQN